MIGTYRALLAAIAAGVCLTLAPAAMAGNVTLWACHGPEGGALGSPLSLSGVESETTGDGVIGTYGGGCTSAASDVTGGGLQASFADASPAGASLANLELGVPANVTLQSVSLERATFGFGSAAIPGDPLTYSASTATGSLESADVLESGDVSFPSATGQDITVGVSCTADPTGSCTTASSPVGVDLSAIALTVSDTDAPKGAVAGVESPIAGSENLEIVASDDGLGLESASAAWDGGSAITVKLGGSTCAPLSTSTSPIDLAYGADCPQTVSGIPINLSTDGLTDGTHQLKVTVTDAAGNTTTLVNSPIQVLNNPSTSSSTATLSLGSGSGSSSTLAAGSTTSTGTTGGAISATNGGTSTCDSPQLSAILRSRPQQIKHGVPVLLRGKVYAFSGTLTCLIAGRSVPAPADTAIEIRGLTGAHATAQTGVALTAQGSFKLLLSFQKSQTLEFIDPTTGAGHATTRLRLTVVSKPK